MIQDLDINNNNNNIHETITTLGQLIINKTASLNQSSSSYEKDEATASSLKDFFNQLSTNPNFANLSIQTIASDIRQTTSLQQQVATPTGSIINNNLDNNSTNNLINNNYVLDQIENILRLSDTCYWLSLVTLILALLILTSIKRLRCPKNTIHLQLFISFIIRAASHLIRRETFNLDTLDSNEWPCKLMTSIWQYSLLANYCWILMEALYLNNLIFSKKISPHGPSVLIYTIFGWLTPLLCITPWIIVKANYEDISCWRDGTNGPYFWILRLPITISILINFAIYIKIVLVLYSKIFSGTLQISTTSAKNNYKRLIRSTLVLIPLFGIHYTALLLVQQWVALAAEGIAHDQAEIVQLYIETFISSLQGSIVASLYCFLNGEVHSEIKRLWIKTPDPNT